jgi:hypothetical protein
MMTELARGTVTTLDRIWWIYMGMTLVGGIYVVCVMIANKRRDRAERAAFERYLHDQPLTSEEIQAELRTWDTAS